MKMTKMEKKTPPKTEPKPKNNPSKPEPGKRYEGYEQKPPNQQPKGPPPPKEKG